jgi:AcrR family transcriptional regulator
MTTTANRPRRADAERNRARILAAASELFAERGLDASMPELAERAGVGVGTVYRAFPDKDHVLSAVMAERFRWLTGEIDAAIECKDPWTAFTDVVWKGAALHAKDRAFHQCLPQALDLPEVSEARGHTLDAFQRLITRAQAAGAERHLGLVIDGLRAEGAHPLPRKPLSRAQLDAMVSELPCPH